MILADRDIRILCEAGMVVSVWNRSRTKAERLLPFGARVADTPADAVALIRLVHVEVEHTQQVELDELAAARHTLQRLPRNPSAFRPFSRRPESSSAAARGAGPHTDSNCGEHRCETTIASPVTCALP